MLAIQREEGRVADAERGRTCRWKERKDVVLTIQDVMSDCLDRERVDVVDVDDKATRMKTDNHNGHGNHETTITHSIGCCSVFHAVLEIECDLLLH